MDYVGYFASAALGVIGYVGVQFAVKPISELRTTREAIAKSLVLFANADTVVNVTGSDDARARGEINGDIQLFRTEQSHLVH